MGQVVITTTVAVTDAQSDVTTHEWAKTIGSLTEFFRAETVIADGATETLWDPRNESVSDLCGDFDVLVFKADQAIKLEFTCNEGDANEELFTHVIASGCPFILGDDGATYNHSTNDAFTTVDVIDKIRIKNSSGSSATVLLIMGT
jgi:hypothetical protein